MRFLRLLIIFFWSLPLFAETISPASVEITTPVYQVDQSDYRPKTGSYLYKVTWQGIPAAEATLTVKDEGTTLRIKLAAKTYQGIDLLYRLRYFAEGRISSHDFLPISTIIDHRENSKHRQIFIDFNSEGEIKSVRTQAGKEDQVIEFKPNNFTLDPFSAAFLARGLDWEIGETKEFDTFNGKSRYLIELTALEKIKMMVNDQMRDVWIISPRVTNLTNPANSKKLRAAKIYVTADKERDVLQIVSSVFIGSVKTKLVSFTPSTEYPSGAMASKADEISFN